MPYKKALDKNSDTKENDPSESWHDSVRLFKFWFNHSGKYIITTVVDNKINPIILSQDLKDYDVVKEYKTKKNFRETIKHGDIISLDIKHSDGKSLKDVVAYIWIEKFKPTKSNRSSYGWGYHDIDHFFSGKEKSLKDAEEQIPIIFAIQDKADGSTPMYDDGWMGISQFSWSLAGNDFKNVKLLKPKDLKPQVKNIGFDFDEMEVDDNSPVSISNLLKEAEFAIIMNFDKIRNSDYMHKTIQSVSRVKNQMGTKLKQTDADIKKQNIERYLSKLAEKYDLAKNIVNCNNLVKRLIGGKYSLYKLHIDRGTIISELSEIMELITSIMNPKEPEVDKKKSRIDKKLSRDELKKQKMEYLYSNKLGSNWDTECITHQVINQILILMLMGMMIMDTKKESQPPKIYINI